MVQLTPADITSAASLLGVTVAHIRAIADVESSGAGFDKATGRVIIRFEPHWFQKLTKGRFNKTHPSLSHSYDNRHNYAQPKTQPERWDRQLRVAMALDIDAAIQATSFGLFQVMGFNYRLCGFKTPRLFLAAMEMSEGEQLKATVRFIRGMGLVDELQELDWAGFARVYNGAAYASAPGRTNDYDTRLARAYQKRLIR